MSEPDSLTLQSLQRVWKPLSFLLLQSLSSRRSWNSASHFSIKAAKLNPSKNLFSWSTQRLPLFKRIPGLEFSNPWTISSTTTRGASFKTSGAQIVIFNVIFIVYHSVTTVGLICKMQELVTRKWPAILQLSPKKKCPEMIFPDEQ